MEVDLRSHPFSAPTAPLRRVPTSVPFSEIWASSTFALDSREKRHAKKAADLHSNFRIRKIEDKLWHCRIALDWRGHGRQENAGHYLIPLQSRSKGEVGEGTLEISLRDLGIRLGNKDEIVDSHFASFSGLSSRSSSFAGPLSTFIFHSTTAKTLAETASSEGKKSQSTLQYSAGLDVRYLEELFLLLNVGWYRNDTRQWGHRLR